jgi:hypothetical protein
MMLEEACNDAAQGAEVGLFFPAYKYQSEVFQRAIKILHPLRDSSSKTEGVIRLKNGGRLDFWSLDNEDAGRSRRYHKVFLDECSLKKGEIMTDIWEQAIKPTLLDFGGEARVYGTPKGVDDDNFFYRICHDMKYRFAQFHAPTRTNPFLNAAEIERLKDENAPLVYAQEYEAEFVNWAGEAFFSLDNLLVDSAPVKAPEYCDAVFAVIDTANKSGMEHDGTSVIYFAKSNYFGHPLVVLDWDLVQIDGALLETWLPTVMQTLESFAGTYKARMGSGGVFIEDKSSGITLLQQGRNRGWNVNAIESKLTSLGKDERAINISGYVYQGKVKFAETAYNRVKMFKNITKNHMVAQVLGFRPGDKDAYMRADDLLDAFTYGVTIGLGNSDGF